MPTNFNAEALEKKLSRMLGIRNFSWQVESKSLDARKKQNIFWLLKVVVHSPELKGEALPEKERLEIPYRKRNSNVVVVGSGPAGFFAAFVLQKAGFNVILIERGSDVKTRGTSIRNFEKTGAFDCKNNYAFGEGGAGTFSDGKLTSRSKHISKEKQFITECYIAAGAPEEIAYMAHPHLGTNNLRKIVKNLRDNFQAIGGKFLFDTMFERFSVKKQSVTEVITSNGNFRVDALFVAPGHSAHETYLMLMEHGVTFRTKNFAIGSRMEHRQEVINRAQWGKPQLPGVKAAEYRLTSPADGIHQVFSFCMCPGGMVVPAAAYADTNIVNGMSHYQRNGAFANAACVAGIHPDELTGKTVSPQDALKYLGDLEKMFYAIAGGYGAPFCNIQDFIQQKEKTSSCESSYPLGLLPLPLWRLLPKTVVHSMQHGLTDFIRKMKGFETGILLGLESKTSSPVQVVRERNGLCAGFDNLYLIGEGSGFAGGIMSSAADGIKAAMSLAGS